MHAISGLQLCIYTVITDINKVSIILTLEDKIKLNSNVDIIIL